MADARDADVIIIGAGIACLAAAGQLACGGLSVLVLEARDRIGGRILSAHDAACNLEIPLGAEFIHGMPAEIWEPLQKAGIGITEVEGTDWCVADGELRRCDFLSEVESVLDKMSDAEPDESFLDFLDRQPGNTLEQKRAKQEALRYVVGFNAADPNRVGVHWLMEEMKAEETIEGDRAFRPDGGYGSLLEFFRKKATGNAQAVHMATVVERVTWKPGHVEVGVDSPKGRSVLTAASVLITLPLSILKLPAGQPGAVEFSPSLPQTKIDAMERLKMGKIIRVTLRFRERFWDAISPSARTEETLSDMAFLFTEDEWFPTWWTTNPTRLPIITGWAPASAAERLSGQDPAFVIEHCLQSLSNSLKIELQTLQGLLEASYFHDWQTDPFSRGAYSYGKVGSDGAQEALGAPVENTLFFAGEATDISGNNGTVHGAIASGYRAAREILQR